MLLNYDYFQVICLILSYIIIYNLTSLLLFFTIVQVINDGFKTLYSFSNLNSTSFYSKILSLAILSLAGVPPFIGFFSKVFIFLLVIYSKLITLLLPLFIFLFAGLYFYIQNLRFLNATNRITDTPNAVLSNSSCANY